MSDVRSGNDVTVIAVPAPLSTTGSGTEATALRVTIATDSTGVLSVDDNGASLTVDGTVTANAGTNLNTSALALESGGNLAAQTTALQILDDWDETDRAKVNPIVGQAGVQGGSGAVSNNTQRVVLATDVALPTGSNAIGKLAANSGVDIGDVDVTSLPALAAGTNLIGRTSASNETSTIYNGTTALTPKFAVIDVAASGDNTIVAAVSTKKIRVHQLFLVAAGTVTVRFESGAGGTALTGQMNLVVNSGFALPYSPMGWFETAATTLLNLELSAAVSVDGVLGYSEV